ncbi:hypothetical protein ABLE68_13435 [Nocardioides sp. CN2-186]|uniref:hypothetical protein n=1 Tax=Nocardioides tweenelious TaxID=3156607 RepID=UPI0032B615B6
MTTDLRDVLHDRLDAVVAPVGDLDGVRASGRRLRRRRRIVAGGGVVLASVLVIGALGYAGSGDDRPTDRGLEPVGPMDFDQGLRAYADPGHEIHLGGRTFPSTRLDYLDTDAAATPYGVVFYAGGRPRLLQETGKVADLEPDAEGTDFHPTAKVDAQGPLVAYGVTIDGQAEVVVRDLDSDEVVARHDVSRDTVIDALDGGTVFLRTDAGTTTWDTVTGQVDPFAGPKTRVADVRNGVVLYDGPEPADPDTLPFFLVKGAIDAQLTYDGSHVLSWSNRLEPTDGGRPIVLDVKATFYAVDTDGSILAAGFARGGGAVVHDCEVPSGECTELGPLTTKGGDPMFIGVDM